MLGTAMITILFTFAYLVVSLLCPRGVPTVTVVEVEPQPRHKAEQTVEQELYAMLIEAWLKGEERWLKYAMVETWPMTQSWL
jgi:hypothetical protein